MIHATDALRSLSLACEGGILLTLAIDLPLCLFPESQVGPFGTTGLLPKGIRSDPNRLDYTTIRHLV